VVALCDQPPTGLQALRQTDVDTIHVRLIHAGSEANWNGLLREGFVPPSSGAASGAAAVEAAIVEGEYGGSAASFELSAGELSDGQDLDIMSAPEAVDAEPAAAEAAPSAQAGLDRGEIDEIFGDLGEAPEDSDPNAEMFAQFGLADEDEPEQIQVFDEDIFAGDFAGELEATAGVAAGDIDAMFEDFGKGVDSNDEICGVHVDEFDSAAPAPQAAEATAVQVAESVPVAADASTDGSWCIPEGIAFNYASKSGTELFADFLDAFIEEGSSELEKLEDAIGAWESDVTSEPAFAVVARTLHTIKGIAKGVGLQYYGTLIHNYETLLEALPRPEPGADAEYFRIVNAWLDAAVRGMDYVSSNRSDIVSEFPQQGGAAVDGAEVAEAGADVGTVEAKTAEADAVQATPPTREPRDARRRQLDKQLADEGAKVLAAQQSVRITSEKLDHLLNLSNQAQQLGVRTAQSTNKGKRTSAEMQARLSSVRAHIANIADRTLLSAGGSGEQRPEDLDALEMDRYSELQEAANILREGVEDLIDLVELASRQNSQVEALLKQQATVIASIGSSIRAARVVPVSRLMPGLRRIVRTVSTDLDKTVSFKVLNEVGTLDRDDYARCQIILEHMVRNALDHGIESREEREAAGKSAAGQIAIDVRKCGADQIITLSDDGRGIDPEAMRESALKKGLDVDIEALTDDEAIRLIFHKGFSTASTVSQISGRGVGMDIVLTELQEMGGDIQIDSTVGQGTSFRIRIPSNVAVNGALLVTAGENSYAIPLGGLISVEHVPVGDFFAAVEEGAPLSLSGMSCEPAYLGTLCQGESLPERKAWGASVPVIIAGSPERYMAIAIDDVEEALELVIRSLGAQFATVPGLAGAATTADGEAVVALDLNLLIADVANSNQMQLSVSKEKADSLLALVVDDSRTQRMVTTSQLETVGVETVTAENGGVAIDLLNTAERLPDVILLDVEMPVKDGIQTLREIRKSVRYGHLPVIMVTSRTGLKHRSLAQEAGCNGYMGKPFNFRMLVGQINELTGHRLQVS
jgi:chemosensory pili system protein ChpA (sensor histidine kinase/response regulator)